MIVHFSSSSKDISKRIDILRALAETIRTSGHTLSREWLDEAVNVTQKNRSDIQRWKKISQKTLEALKAADVVIIEASVDSFSMGFQAALAIQLKKPLLILRSRNNAIYEYYVDVYSEEKPVEQSLLAGDTSSLKSIGVYKNADEAATIIKEFLQKNDLDKTDMRFNMFLDRGSYQYLERISQQSGKTKAKIIRDMLKEKAKNNV